MLRSFPVSPNQRGRSASTPYPVHPMLAAIFGRRAVAAAAIAPAEAPPTFTKPYSCANRHTTGGYSTRW